MKDSKAVSSKCMMVCFTAACPPSSAGVPVRSAPRLIYFGDVHVGTIGRRAGVPTSAPQWGGSCGGFYPAWAMPLPTQRPRRDCATTSPQKQNAILDSHIRVAQRVAAV
jgi:hypothetical protein